MTALRADAVEGGSGGGVTAPVAGSSDDGGTFVGTLTISGAAFDPALGPVLLARIRGVVTPDQPDGADSPSEVVTVSFEDVPLSYKDDVKTDPDCIEIRLSPPSLVDAVTKTSVNIESVPLLSVALPGPANLIAELICADDEAIEAGWSVQPGPA